MQSNGFFAPSWSSAPRHALEGENLLGRDQKWGRLLGLGPGGQQMQSHGRESGIMENMDNSCHEAMPMGDYAGAPHCDEPCCP